MKKFEPQYRLVRVGLATKAERASRQQSTFSECSYNDARNAGSLTGVTTQGSRGRTDRRPSAVPPRSRVPRPRRRNKRLAPRSRVGLSSCVYILGDFLGLRKRKGVYFAHHRLAATEQRSSQRRRTFLSSCGWMHRGKRREANGRVEGKTDFSGLWYLFTRSTFLQQH